MLSRLLWESLAERTKAQKRDLNTSIHLQAPSLYCLMGIDPTSLRCGVSKSFGRLFCFFWCKGVSAMYAFTLYTEILYKIVCIYKCIHTYGNHLLEQIMWCKFWFGSALIRDV